MRVMHIITSLNNGGAEATLFRLISSDQTNIHIVVSLMDLGIYGSKLSEIGVQVETLNFHKGKISGKGLLKLYKLMRTSKPDLVQTWMYHADLIGGLIAKISGIENIVWNLRQSNLDKKLNSRMTLIIVRLCSMLSSMLPKKIISCSNEASLKHIEFGYSKSKIAFIPNGYDTSKLQRNLSLAEQFRKEWDIPEKTQLLAMVGRWDPQKDHQNLLQALSLLKSTKTSWKCALVGPKMDKSNNELIQLIKTHDLENEVLLIGPTNNVATVMSALDIHLLSSAGEAFPNVVAEAMACEVPCVTTDVGDAKYIVGNTGWVVPPKNHRALSTAIGEALNELQDSERWMKRKHLCRQRIINDFTIDKMVKSYNNVWIEIFNKGKS